MRHTALFHLRLVSVIVCFLLDFWIEIPPGKQSVGPVSTKNMSLLTI
jgi:hypothetical protein